MNTTVTNQNTELLRMTTAGSVDDGKSTLIGQLLLGANGVYEDQLSAIQKSSAKKGDSEIDLALIVDGLAAEREQGITIDVAYRYFSTPKRRFIVMDVPGHTEYTRNMITGASNANLAMILIDARKGLIEQSKRHLFIATLLGIPHILIVVNKMDQVEYDQRIFEDIKSDISQYASKLNLTDLQFIPVSALKGDNVVKKSENMDWYSGDRLLGYLESLQISIDRNLIDFRFPVQYVIRPNQDFRGYAGMVEGGVIKKGDEVQVLPSGKKTRPHCIACCLIDKNKTSGIATHGVRINHHGLCCIKGHPSHLIEFQTFCFFTVQIIDIHSIIDVADEAPHFFGRML